jgi:hypothetical protein
MEVKIGIQHAPRELVVETDASAEDIERELTEALASDGVLALTDTKGRRVVVPAGQVAYVEFGAHRPGTVGFR